MSLERQTSNHKACEVVGVSRRTIYNWRAWGKLEICVPRGLVRIRGRTLESPERRPRPAQPNEISTAG